MRNNDDWSWFDGFDSDNKEDTTLVNDNKGDREAIRRNENSSYREAADKYEREARRRSQGSSSSGRSRSDQRKSDPRERRLNTGGSSGSGRGSLYSDGHSMEYNGYERSGGAYDSRARANRQGGYAAGSWSGNGWDNNGFDSDEDRAIRARNLAREARYKDIDARAQEEELRRLREDASYDSERDNRNRKRQKRLAKKQRKKKNGKGRKIKKIILALLILFLLFCGYFMVLASHFDKVDTSDKDLGIDPAVDDALSGYRNIAVLGSDARSDESLDGSRTDAIIILSIKKSNGDINMISIMRDSYLKLENQNKELVLDKITHAHHWAGGVGTISALNRSLDLNIKEYVIFNWQAVADTVDALDGITVDIKRNELRDLNKWGPETGKNVGRKYHRISKTGEQEIDGVQATTYCRIRKTSGGDPGRGRRYKKVMAAVMKKAITHPWKLNALANDVFPNIRTNMSSPGMLWAVLRAPGYDIKKSYGWPKKYYGGILGNGLWYAVPQTLKWNVKWLHKRAFEQDDYSVSDTCSDISDEIIYQTGIQ